MRRMLTMTKSWEIDWSLCAMFCLTCVDVELSWSTGASGVFTDYGLRSSKDVCPAVLVVEGLPHGKGMYSCMLMTTSRVNTMYTITQSGSCKLSEKRGWRSSEAIQMDAELIPSLASVKDTQVP